MTNKPDDFARILDALAPPSDPATTQVEETEPVPPKRDKTFGNWLLLATGIAATLFTLMYLRGNAPRGGGNPVPPVAVVTPSPVPTPGASPAPKPSYAVATAALRRTEDRIGATFQRALERYQSSPTRSRKRELVATLESLAAHQQKMTSTAPATDTAPSRPLLAEDRRHLTETHTMLAKLR